MSRIHRRVTRGFGIFAVFFLACATPRSTPIDAPGLEPVDLSPRCLEIEALPALAGSLLPGIDDPVDADGIAREALPGGATLYRDLATNGPARRARLLLGFAWPEAERDAAGIAAALLREAESTASPAAFRAALDRHHARLDVEVGHGRLWLGLDLPESARAQAAPLFARWLAIADVPPDDFARARRRAGLQRLAQAADPRAIASHTFDRLRGLPPTEGDDAPARDAATLLPRMRARLVPDASTFALASASFGPADVAPLFAESARARPVAPSASLPLSAPASLPPRAIVVVDRPGAPQVEVLVGHATVALDHPDALALELLASGLGGNVGGRLFADLRERRGLVYAIDAAQEASGRFVVSTRARPERVPSLVAGIEAHLAALRDEPFLECEAANWRRRHAGERALRSADPARAMARHRETLEFLGRLPRQAGERATRATIDSPTLTRAARSHLAGPPIVVLVGDRHRLDAAFSQIDPDRRRLRLDALPRD